MNVNKSDSYKTLNKILKVLNIISQITRDKVVSSVGNKLYVCDYTFKGTIARTLSGDSRYRSSKVIKLNINIAIDYSSQIIDNKYMNWLYDNNNDKNNNENEWPEEDNILEARPISQLWNMSADIIEQFHNNLLNLIKIFIGLKNAKTGIENFKISYNDPIVDEKCAESINGINNQLTKIKNKFAEISKFLPDKISVLEERIQKDEEISPEFIKNILS